MFLPVPRGLLKGTGRRFHQGQRSPGAQPEIASKAVREEIEDRLHGQAAVLRSCGRARRLVARGVFFSSTSTTVRRPYIFLSACSAADRRRSPAGTRGSVSGR